MGLNECPAGGEHEWAEQDSGDAYGYPYGATIVHRWIACDNCGATPPPTERNEP